MMQLSYSYFCRKKFAAMFGLDARIALAIFGALSIITGAVLYNVLEQSKATTLLAELNETGKAIEQYYLHTRKMPSRWSSDSNSHEFYNYKLVDLVKAPNPTVKGWKGPYLPYGVHSNNNDLNNKRIDADNHLGAFLLEQNPVFGDMTMWTNALCTAGKKCNLWSYFRC